MKKKLKNEQTLLNEKIMFTLLDRYKLENQLLLPHA